MPTVLNGADNTDVFMAIKLSSRNLLSDCANRSLRWLARCLDGPCRAGDVAVMR
jgi:hypothetical protein